jgi:hypothetical protein
MIEIEHLREKHIGLSSGICLNVPTAEFLSWKVTEPVRRLMTALRSGPRKTQ